MVSKKFGFGLLRALKSLGRVQLGNSWGKVELSGVTKLQAKRKRYDTVKGRRPQWGWRRCEAEPQLRWFKFKCPVFRSPVLKVGIGLSLKFGNLIQTYVDWRKRGSGYRGLGLGARPEDIPTWKWSHSFMQAIRAHVIKRREAGDSAISTAFQSVRIDVRIKY